MLLNFIGSLEGVGVEEEQKNQKASTCQERKENDIMLTSTLNSI